MKIYFMKSLFKNILTVVFLFFISCGSGPEPINLTSWEILYEQEDSLEKVIVRDEWKPVDIPSKIELPYAPVRGFQFVWLRSSFWIAGDPSLFYGVSTGRIQYSDKIYINNTLVGFLNTENVNWSLLPRNYTIPDGVLKKGKNEIYIQLGIYSKYPGGVLNDVYILSENDFKLLRFIRELVNKHIPIGTVIILACITIVLFVFFLMDRRERLFFYYLFALIATILYILIPQSSFRIFSFEVFSAILFSLFPAFMLFFLFLFQRAYRIYFIGYNIAIASLLSLFILIIFLSRNEIYNYQLAFILTFITAIIMVPSIYYILFNLNSRNPDRFLFYMLFTIFTIAISTMIIEICTAFSGGTSTGVPAKNVPLLLILLGMVTYIRDFVKRKKEMDFISDKFRRYKERKNIISDSLEEKLNTVIDLIRENYTSDLSREGLAAVVDLHPNTLGRIFKKYTGKTINDYVNNLRIDEAKIKITESNEKIVDIAFSTGFESLATFNRVFRNLTGKSPSEYKDTVG